MPSPFKSLQDEIECPPAECDYPVEADVVKDVEYAFGEKIGTYECPPCPEAGGLPKTGQEEEYYPGDDGTYQAGYPLESPRFIDNGDGTITDRATGLMWQQAGEEFQGNWEDAIDYAENLELGGHNDWRLPNIKELQSIVNYGNWSAAIGELTVGGSGDGAPFTNTQSAFYWSSTTFAVNSANAWFVYFYDGNVYYNDKTYDLYYARCVRQ